MINFEKVNIHNFMSIGEAEVKLDTGGFTLISAVNNRVEDAAKSNGAGKSSISESIVWALAGESIRGNKEVVNRYTEGDCTVEVYFSFKGHSWLVKRSMNRSKEKSLETYRDGQLLPAKGYRDSVEVLERELPELTFKFLNSVVVLGQGLPGRFTNNSPSGRKAVLEELTNADFMINHVKEKIQKRKADLQLSLRSAEDSRLADVSTRDRVESELEKSKAELEELNKFDLAKAEEELESLVKRGLEQRAIVESLTEKIENKKSLYSGVLREQETISIYYENKAKLLTERAKGKYDLEKKLIESKLAQDRAEVEREYSEKVSAAKDRIFKEQVKETNELDSSRRAVHDDYLKACRDLDKLRATLNSQCPTCGQRLPGITEEQLEKAKVEAEQVESNRDLLKRREDEISEKLTEIGELADKNFDGEKAAIFGQRDKVIAGLEESAKSKIDKLTLGLVSLSEDIKVLEGERDWKLLELSEKKKLFEEELDKLFEALKANRTRLEIERETYQVKKSEKEVYLTKLEYVNKAVESAVSQLADLEKKIIKGTEIIEDCTSHLEVVKKMETFAARDFRGVLLEEVIARLDQILKGYADKVYGNKLTSFYQDGNAIVVEFDGKEYEALSGGEQQKINVILQLALRDLIIELTGVTGSLLILDEVFDGLDSYGCERMVNLFHSLDISVFIITHHADSLAIPNDYQLVVVKGEDGVATIVTG